MSEFDFAAVMRAIKTILKVKKMTYRDLAEILEMSESGVKKILSAKDGSFGRVLQMCRALDVSLDDLIAEAADVGPHVVRFTPEQMAFFENNPSYFCFLNELMGVSIDPIDLLGFVAK